MKQELLGSTAPVRTSDEPVKSAPAPAPGDSGSPATEGGVGAGRGAAATITAVPLHAGRRASAAKVAEPDDDIDFSALPRRVDRRVLADLVTKFYFPVSHRTVEAWPLVVKRVNGKATLDTREGLAFAKSKLDAAPAIRGGRRAGAAAA